MAGLTGKSIGDAVNAFLGTYYKLEDRKKEEERQAKEDEYRAFYYKLLGEQDKRAAESHDAEMDRGRLQLEALQRDADANAAILAEHGKTVEQLVAENNVAGLGQYAEQMRQLALEQATLQKQTAQYMLDVVYPQQVATSKAAAARSTALTANSGKKKSDPFKELQDQYETMDARRKSLDSMISNYITTDPVTGVKDMSAVPPQLLDARQELEIRMNELNTQLSDAQAGVFGLSQFDRTAPLENTVPDDGLSPAERALKEAGLPAKPTKEERERFEAWRAGQTNLGTRKAVVEGADGTLVATDDEKLITRAKRAEDTDGKRKVWRMEEVPSNWLGTPAEQFRQRESGQGYPPAAPGSYPMMDPLKRFGLGGPGGF